MLEKRRAIRRPPTFHTFAARPSTAYKNADGSSSSPFCSLTIVRLFSDSFPVDFCRQFGAAGRFVRTPRFRFAAPSFAAVDPPARGLSMATRPPIWSVVLTSSPAHCFHLPPVCFCSPTGNCRELSFCPFPLCSIVPLAGQVNGSPLFCCLRNEHAVIDEEESE